MNRTQIWKAIIGLCAALLLTACVSDPVNFGKPLDFESGRKYDESQGKLVVAKACGFHLLYLIPIATNDRALRAYERVKSLAGDKYITDIHIKERWAYGFVGTSYCTYIRAMTYPWLPS